MTADFPRPLRLLYLCIFSINMFDIKHDSRLAFDIIALAIASSLMKYGVALGLRLHGNPLQHPFLGLSTFSFSLASLCFPHLLPLFYYLLVRNPPANVARALIHRLSLRSICQCASFCLLDRNSCLPGWSRPSCKLAGRRASLAALRVL